MRLRSQHFRLQTGARGDGILEIAPAGCVQSRKASESVAPRLYCSNIFNVRGDDVVEVVDNLLIVCSGNLCRSPMAAQLFRAATEGRTKGLGVSSAGIAALVGQPPPAPVIALMARRNLDVSGHRARQLTGSLAHGCNLILVMETAQRRFIEKSWSPLRGRVRRLGDWRDTEILDPYGSPEESYGRCLNLIEACVRDWQERIWS